MRGSTRLLCVALALAFAGPALAASGADRDKTDKADPLTERHESVGRAVGSPLEDLNLKKVPIPPVLEAAVARTYDVANMNRCAAISAEIARLDDALGPDRDAPPEDQHRDAGSTASGLMRVGAESIVPYRGIVRRITGASSYQARVQQAIYAGLARRGYLKGLGMGMNCAPPAAPAWFKPSRPRPVRAAAVRPAPRPAARPARPVPARPAPARPAPAPQAPPKQGGLHLPAWLGGR
jgi:hypothetical protein